MKVLCSEGVANHAGPEPCVIVREVDGEASVGDRAGWPSSRERKYSRVPTAYQSRKATRFVAPSRVATRLGVVEDPSMHGRSLFGNREVSSLALGVAHHGSAQGRPKGRSLR